MARFLLVLKPQATAKPAELIAGLLPWLEALAGEVDHQTTAHLSAVLRTGGDQQRMQLFADVQSKADGLVLELAVMSREPMGRGAPQTLAVFQELANLALAGREGMELLFRSDRDGAIPA